VRFALGKPLPLANLKSIVLRTTTRGGLAGDHWDMKSFRARALGIGVTLNLIEVGLDWVFPRGCIHPKDVSCGTPGAPVMEGPTTPNDAPPSFRSPPRILIPKLVESRDKWKAKAGRRKKELKKAQIRSRDLSVSRDLWKERALAAERELQVARQHLDQRQRELEQAHAEVTLLLEEAQKRGACPRS
jgi:hypothetical protein